MDNIKEDYLNNDNISHIPAISAIIDDIHPNNDHLIVLCHGMLGYASDLQYVADHLTAAGCIILQIESNQHIKSLDGIITCADRVIHDIITIQAHHHNILKRISFIGNSYGGIINRQVIKSCHNKDNHTMCNLIPYKFMTIATPHLGVRDYNIFDDNGYMISYDMKINISSYFHMTGRDLMFADDADIRKTLLYRMAVDDDYISSLSAFEGRRLYVNLYHDSMVSLGTGGIMGKDMVDDMRRRYHHMKGIVDTIITPTLHHHDDNQHDHDDNRSYLHEMIHHLDACGWEKVIVHFPGLSLPTAHNKLCALSPGPRYNRFITDTMFNFQEGRYVMDHAAHWLTIIT